MLKPRRNAMLTSGSLDDTDDLRNKRSERKAACFGVGGPEIHETRLVDVARGSMQARKCIRSESERGKWDYKCKHVQHESEKTTHEESKYAIMWFITRQLWSY